MTQQPNFFDGHNDVLTRLCNHSVSQAVNAFLNGDNEGHIDLPRMQTGRMVGGLFALFASSPTGNAFNLDDFTGTSYDIPLPPDLPLEIALSMVLRQASLLHRFVDGSAGQMKLCRSSNDIEESITSGAIAAIMHMEGAEALDDDLLHLDLLYKLGLRSLGPVWSRPTKFAHGVPFTFPGSPDTGPGLTSLGKALVVRCNELGILIDLSHINERGFWDIAELSSSPLIATHSNAHALCRSSRNLTDEQLQAIKNSDGMVGVNLATSFLREDGQMRSDTNIELVLKHMDYLISAVGEDRVGLGSDFDGALIPESIGSVAGLSVLSSAMYNHGYSADLINKLCNRNWINALQRVWES